MKNLSLAFNAILAILVIVLFCMYFSLKSSLAQGGQTSAQNNKPAETNKSGGLTIAYINDDSVSANYTVMRALSKDMQNREEALQAQYETKGRKLQEEYADYQQKAQAGNLSQVDAQKAQEDLGKKKSELDGIQRQQDELVKEAQEKNQKLSEKVLDYVNQYNKTKHYDYVLTYSSTHGPLIVVNPSGDITKEIVAELNKDAGDSLQKAKR